jgi:hypothetical protein
VKNHIIFFSGGKSSFAVAAYVKDQYPDDNILLYFNDTLWENEDLYRFIDEVSDKLQLPMLTHSMGITPLQLMHDMKFVFNSRVGECSKILKMRVARNFIKRGKRPPIEKWRNKQYLKQDDVRTDATLYFGIGFDEMHREKAIVENWKPFDVQMPLIENNIDTKALLKKYAIRQPILYDFGFAHNNCNGRCVKAGQGHYRLLKEKMPDVFEEIMEQEHHISMYVSAYHYITDDKGEDTIPKDVQESMLSELEDAYRDYFSGKAKRPGIYIHPAAGSSNGFHDVKIHTFMRKKSDPYSLRQLHYDVENEPEQIDIFDIGGCGCFVHFEGAG